MTIRVALQHHTSYHFDRPVNLSPHLIRLRPAPHCRTPVEAYSLTIGGGPHFLNWQQDPFGNFIARAVFPETLTQLTVDIELIAPMTVINPFDFFVEPYAETFPFAYPEALAKELAPYLEVREAGPRLRDWLSAVAPEARGSVDFLVDLNQRLQRDIAYLVRMEPGVQSCEETLANASGSCRDSAWLLVQILRHLGLAARFVSGYLIQLAADVKALDGPSGTEVDFTDLHAWTEVFIPGAGWVGLDPTSGLLAGEGHIPLAATPEPSSAAPISGFSDECEVEFDVTMHVERIHEEPRVTKPYSETQWAEIMALGEAVDERLAAGDVRLTLGGEPTFVSIDDMDGEEWNTAALGPHKRRLAGDLLKRLRRRFAPGGLLHTHQGKWYPGESLPRWALACYWRRDGVPLWRDETLLADARQAGRHTLGDARRFAEALTRRLGLDPRHLIPGYEDAYYYLWRERTLPVNVDPRDYDLDDDEERRRLGQLLERGLGEATGFALPLRHARGRDHAWQSGHWPLRCDHLYLIPGDSPMGLRLPLSALPWVERPDSPHPQSLFEFRQVLGDIHGEVMRRYSELRERQGGDAGHGLHHESDDETWQAQASPEDDREDRVIHTSLCVEPRDGRVHVFMPPLTRLEHYLDLVASIEDTAAELAMPVIVEGYPPPADPRLAKFLITPDPGVIEVNIMPAEDWPSLVAHTETLYEQARQSRLGTEKFMLDGRHTGTGGGNHVTLGGATPADSPFLRRPDLLGSLLTYWQHHPSLSYLFSGLFIGPTSQAPRVDEARHEALYELEIALAQMPEGEVPQPWLVDRLLRHLLTDITGNTHRAEFCIDKLYSPDSETGRLGLVELRGFEMPPHARMSLMQMLLIRALVARCWERPYRGKLVRWGTALHDRWLLPHCLWSDLGDVLDDLRRHGFDFRQEWFAPFLEFRFPVHGRVAYRDVRLELRQAIEPWHVLGEENASGGTARYVDSSVERVQVRVEGMSGDRYAVTCNGRRVPLTPTGRVGEAVAGVRFRAWQPPSALHPRIPVQAPLVFDVVDTWNARSVGGCTYHVSHPAGRNYETFPVNANEAEARRLARFRAEGHTQGAMSAPPEAPSLELPMTLDLRRMP
ncbi:transglutaminase family protein [Modicisalibacter tunisiensis]|uniref:transglutaminase family protein n=1 Tax=Modicisalibacter tunisiensis TaxID=390637 RepID=UPI001CCB8ACB|nr:transglutaminase family protein [Modicisalibacter tunisiensis]MBZ9537955.1 transglutaminase family protein [Modicisalibacter tunisiensis]